MFIAIVTVPVAIYCSYEAWRFAFRYQEELLRPVSGRQAGYQHLFLQSHGHVGVVILLAVSLLCGLVALNGVWRFWTALPAVILLPDTLWLHPSFGRKPIPYTNIVSVSLDRIDKRQVALKILTEDPIQRNWAFWTSAGSPYRVAIRELIIDASLYDLARFRNRLASLAEAARGSMREPAGG
jgi:hypothetical protein